jgi:hypothetical protein
VRFLRQQSRALSCTLCAGVSCFALDGRRAVVVGMHGGALVLFIFFLAHSRRPHGLFGLLHNNPLHEKFFEPQRAAVIPWSACTPHVVLSLELSCCCLCCEAMSCDACAPWLPKPIWFSLYHPPYVHLTSPRSHIFSRPVNAPQFSPPSRKHTNLHLTIAPHDSQLQPPHQYLQLFKASAHLQSHSIYHHIFHTTLH